MMEAATDHGITAKSLRGLGSQKSVRRAGEVIGWGAVFQEVLRGAGQRAFREEAEVYLPDNGADRIDEKARGKSG